MTAVCTIPGIQTLDAGPHVAVAEHSAAAASHSLATPKSGLLGDAGQMTLRVRGGEHDGRMLKIRSSKCTIGSAEGCTLRLRAPGISQLSCWVLRGPGGTIVRRMDGPMALNGARCEEASLRVGDCLRLGSIELQVVACNEPAPQATSLFPPVAVPPADVNELKAELNVLQERAARLEAECRQGFESSIMAAERADQLRDALAVAHEQLESLSTELATIQNTASQQADELEARHQELDQLHASQRSLTAQLEEANTLVRTFEDERTALAAERDDAVRERDSLTHERDNLARGRDESVSERDGLQRRCDELARQCDELARQRDDLARERDALLHERNALATERDSLAQEQDAAANQRLLADTDRERLSAELNSAHAALQAEQERFTAERTQLERRLAQRDAEIEALRSSSAAQTGAMTVAMTELTQNHEGLRTELSARCADLEAQLAARQSEYESQLAALQSDHSARLLTQQHELQSQLASQRCDLENQLAARQVSIDDLNGRLSAQQCQFEGQVASKQSEIEHLAAQLSSQRGELEGLLGAKQAALEELQAQLAAKHGDFDANLASKQGDLEAVTRRAAELEQKLAELQGKMAEVEGQRQSSEADLRRELADKCRELDECRQRLELQTAATGATAEFEAKEQEVLRQRAEIDARLASFDQRHQELESQQQSLAAEKAEFARTREQCDLDRDELLLAKQELADAQEQLTQDRLNIEQQREWLLAAQAQQQAAQAQQEALQAQQESLQAQQHALQAADAELQVKASLLDEQLAAAALRLAEIERLRDDLLSEKARLAVQNEQLIQRESELSTRQPQRMEPVGVTGPEVWQHAAAMQDNSPAQVPFINAPATNLSALEAPVAEFPTAKAPASDDQAVNHVAFENSEMPVNCTAVWSPEQLAALSDLDAFNAAPARPALNSVQSQLAPPSDAGPGEGDSGDVDALLGRLVRAGLWRTDETPAAEPAPLHPAALHAAPPTQQHSPAPRPAAASELPAADFRASQQPLIAPADDSLLPQSFAPTANVPEEEESIESYMDRLMKRVRGDAPGPVMQTPIVIAPSPAPVAVEAAPEPAAEPADENGEYSPRRTAPELVTNLSAMRELANTAARSAIDRHVRQHTGKQAAGKLIGACLTVAASGLVGYWAVRAASLPAGVAAFIGGGAGAYWTWAAFKRLTTLRRLNLLNSQESQPTQAVDSASSATTPPTTLQ